MLRNTSPWLAQLKRIRPVTRLSCDTKKDLAIVGGGIAGITTAYYALNMTDMSVVLLEADKLAHGATGHNGGQAVHYFERPFADIVAEYGLEMAGDAQQGILSTWDLMEEIYENTGLKTPFHTFTGYAGCAKKEDVLQHLENKYLRALAGIYMEEVTIAKEAPWLHEIPARYKDLYSIMPQQNILSLLETDNDSFYALFATKKGVMNSAMFTEELAGYLLKTFPDRFVIHENSPVTKVITDKKHVDLETQKCTVQADKVVLCTNGFEHFEIENRSGAPVNSKFHMLVNGLIGYMAGYIEPMNKPPMAISYIGGQRDEAGYPIYHYLTRRPFELEKNVAHNLICIGGPEVELSERTQYIRSKHVFSDTTLKRIHTFLHRTFKGYQADTVKLKYHWHGLMGYTRNMLRLIGPEPCNKNLLYNLGCNGVGLLPSVYGAKRVVQFLRGDKLKKSVFDPVDQRGKIKY